VAIAGSRWRLGGWPGSQHILNAHLDAVSDLSS
jgi:hypothetical protein